MRSLRSRLLTLWLMLVASGAATGFLLLESYRQSTNAQVARSEDAVARACRDLAERYQVYVSPSREDSAGANPITAALQSELTRVSQAALAQANGVEGGFWQAQAGSLAYAYPTYEGTGPKTDVPAAELATIRQVNAQALSTQKPAAMREVGASQVLVLHACPLPGAIAGMTGWTMTRTFTGNTRAYNQLLIGLLVVGLTVLGSALWLANILYFWSRKLRSLEAELGAREIGTLPPLSLTGERELDRLVEALNATGARLTRERQRAAAAEGLAAVGRLAAGLAHEIRNPIAAMRLKAENALAGRDNAQRGAALKSILEQVARLDALLRQLLAMTQKREPHVAEVDLHSFLHQTLDMHRELAARKGVNIELGDVPAADGKPQFDPEQMQRALDNLVLNAIQGEPARVTVEAERRNGHLFLRVRDTGAGVPPDIRERLFEPFVTGRPEGTGLGLALVREIARSHGGEARYLPGASGALFEIEVPWRPS